MVRRGNGRLVLTRLIQNPVLWHRTERRVDVVGRSLRASFVTVAYEVTPHGDELFVAFAVSV